MEVIRTVGFTGTLVFMTGSIIHKLCEWGNKRIEILDDQFIYTFKV